MLVTGKHNTYEVIDKCEDVEKSLKWFKIKCVDFYDVDDIGDKNLITGFGQESWVANYHFQHMTILGN